MDGWMDGWVSESINADAVVQLHFLVSYLILFCHGQNENVFGFRVPTLNVVQLVITFTQEKPKSFSLHLIEKQRSWLIHTEKFPHFESHQDLR